MATGKIRRSFRKRRRTGPRLGTHVGDGWSLSEISSLSVEHLADLISSCVFYVGVSENSVPLNPMVNDHYPY